jgi:hypothetical protein
VAVQKRWHWKFGAEVVCIADDVVEMTVSRPPTDRTSALELAREQYVYCEDLVVQGTLTLERLAASLLGAKKWFFWWD